MRRPRRDLHDLYRRAVAYVDRRGGAAIRRGGRLGSGTGLSVRRFEPDKLYGLSGFSTTSYYAALGGGGEAGAMGCTWFALCRIDSQATQANPRALMDRYQGSVGGWTAYFNAAATVLTGMVYDGAIAVKNTPSPTFYPSDVGRLLLLAVQLTTGGQLRVFSHRVFQGAADLAVTGFTPSPIRPHLMGNRYEATSSVPLTGVSLLAHMTVRGDPSLTQMQAFYDQARVLGDLPTTFPLGTAGDADIAALAPRHWYRGDTYTPSSGNLGALTNRNTTVGGSLNVTTGTIALPAADAAFGGRQTVAFDGTQELSSSLSPADWQFLQDGTNMEVVSIVSYGPAVAGSTCCLWSTRNATTGATCSRSTSGNHAFALSSQGTLNLNMFTVGAIPVSTPLVLGDSYGINLNPQYNVWTGPTDIGTGSVTTTPGVPDFPFHLGGGAAATVRFQGAVADILVFDRRLTAAERQTIRDYARIRYGIGVITTTHRWSLRDELAKAELYVTDGQLAPVSLTDTVTAATIDRMDRQGSPTVRVIDPAMDGRKTYGAQGAAGVNYLVSAQNAGLVGNAAGFSVTLVTRWDVLSTLLKGQLYSQNSGAAQGFSLYFLSGTTLRFNVYDGSGVAQACNVTLAAADIGQFLIVTAQHDGTTLRVAINGVERATLPITGYTVQTSNAYVAIGGFPVNHNQLENAAVFDVATSNTPLTPGEVSQLYADFLRTGRIVPLSKHVHRWDITQDIIANGGPSAGIPAQVLDRIGTDHLTRVGGLQVDTGNSVRDFSGTNYFRSIAGAGLLGSASGFWGEVLVKRGELSAAQVVFGCYNTVGWYVSLNNGDAAVLMRATSGSGGGFINSGASALTDALHHIAFFYDGSNSHLFIDGVEKSVSASFVLDPAVAPAATTIGVSSYNGSIPATKVSIYGASGGHFIPSPSEIAAAASAALSTGKVAGIPGKTLKLWSIPDDVTDAGGKVPALLRERVSGVDHMVLIGSGLQVAQRAERLWSYEAA